MKFTSAIILDVFIFLSLTGKMITGNSQYFSWEKSLFYNLGFFDSIMGNNNNNKNK